MAKNPAFQFYPADWRNNAKLRRCSLAARGAWVEVLSLLHDSDEYGICRWPLAEIAQAAGIPLRTLKELVDKGVLKGSDTAILPYIYTPRHAGKEGEPVTLISDTTGPIWYCSRFVRDEYIRSQRGKGTRFGTDRPAPIRQPIRPMGEDLGTRQGDGPSSSSSSSSSDKEREAHAREDFLQAEGGEGKDEKPQAMPERPAYAPTYEQANEYFYQQGHPDITEAFMVENDKTGWTYRDGGPIKNWKPWAAGFIRKQVKKAEQAAAKEVKAANQRPKQSTFVPTRRDFSNEAEWLHYQQSQQQTA